MPVADSPDFQWTVVYNDSPSDTVPGPDSPDWQTTVQIVPSVQGDAPDWQQVAVGPGGSSLKCPNFFDEYIASLSPTYWWKLNETSGTTAADSADANTGTYEGLYSLDHPGLVSGSLATEFTSPGTTPAWVESTSLLAAPTEYSIAAIYNFTDLTPTNVPLLSFNANQSPVGAPLGASDRGLYVDSSNDLDFYFYNGGSLSLTSGPEIGQDWHMVVATLGPAGTFLYKDGTEVDSSANTGDVAYNGYWIPAGAVFSNSWPGYTGGVSQDYYMRGLLQHVIVWETTQLTAAQIHFVWTLT